MKPGIAISGASSGIGAATALLLAEKGYTAFAGVRSDDDARRAAGLHANVRPILLDVTDQSSIERAVDDVSKSGVAIAGIVSNAGIAIGGPLERLPIAELRRQFEVNVFGAVALVQAFLPLLHGGRGLVVFVGSISGRLATPYIGPYSASKFALRALSDAMRIELAPAGIAVSLIEPGSVKTPIWGKGRKTAADMASQLGDRTREHYRAALERVVAITESEERDGMPVAVVSNAIVHALCAHRPRAHYLLGGPARMGSVVAVLPPALRDRAIRASMRIP
ncbi:MAG: SDR family oxidoreductase [Candidatus Eremiobacteraeota bacterium]|nr:SDR family oxidoreductase [Candidatus Eremiobacteraeota bacterium]